MILRVRNVSKAFGGVYAVDRCSLGIKEGTITSLIGPNGAGKTTLFNIINGILKPDKGKIYFRGKEITGFKPHVIAQIGISRTFQLARLFKNMSVRDNLILARPVTEIELNQVLKQVHFTRGLETVTNDLSYGQQRLIEIARALLKPHYLLMLDEPTAGVNPQVRQELKKLLKGLKKQGKTVLLIEHDMEFVMNVSDEIIVLNEGKVLAQGTPKQIRNNPKVLEAYLGK